MPKGISSLPDQQQVSGNRYEIYLRHMSQHDHFMYRCIELAQKGSGRVAPNPLVGAVLVFENRIIGEGWHEYYGGPHAEVNCLRSVREADRSLIDQSTLYVSLEPCSHFGKTPPCTDLIIHHRIPKVVIGCRDPFKEVDGRGIEKLRENGVEVITDVREQECRELNKRFFCFHTQQRPYVILKWAQTREGVMGLRGERLLISNEYSNRLVHRWRSEEAAILVGTGTALADDPALTNRHWPGPNPVRIVLDRKLTLPSTLQLFDGSVKTIVLNTVKQEEAGNLYYHRLPESADLVPAILQALYDLKILSVLVEGGARLLQSFIDAQTWDEIRRISSGRNDFPSFAKEQMILAPRLPESYKISEEEWGTDQVEVFGRG